MPLPLESVEMVWFSCTPSGRVSVNGTSVLGEKPEIDRAYWSPTWPVERLNDACGFWGAAWVVVCCGGGWVSLVVDGAGVVAVPPLTGGGSGYFL